RYREQPRAHHRSRECRAASSLASASDRHARQSLAFQRRGFPVSNPVVHWQLISREPEKLAQFYLTLFGWKISDANGLGYRMVETAQSGKGVDGGIWPAPPGAP